MEITINESIYMALSVSYRSKVSLLLMGNPGAGKTTSVEFFAKANDMKLVLLRGSQSSPEEILGYEVNEGIERVRNGIKVRVASKICPKWYDELLENSDKGIRTLLFLDEITTASSFVQSALLQVIFGREIDNGYKLPDDTFVVAAGNYSGNLSSDFNLIPPLMNRFCIFNVSINKNDIKTFMSRYSERNDIVSKLKMFETTNSTDVENLDKGFVATVKKLMESKLGEYVQSLMSQRKYDPNFSEMSDIYQDQSTGNKLLGFLTPRTLGYYTDVSIQMYLKYGLDGINSDPFREMTSGLVGLSLTGESNNGQSKKEVLTSEFIKVVLSTSQQLDKRRVNSIATSEDRINKIINKLDSHGNLVSVEHLQSPDLISLKKIFDSSSSDREIRKVQTPIETKILLDCSNIIISSIRNTLVNNQGELRDMSEKAAKGIKVDISSIDLEQINGEIKTFNDSVRAHKSLRDFISIPEFKYESDLLNKVKSEDKQIILKNRFRVDTIKSKLSNLGVPMSNLVETESID